MVKRLNLHIKPLVSLLTSLVNHGKNSVYKRFDIAYRLVQSALHNQSLEAMSKLTGYLSADRVLDKLHNISAEQIRNVMLKFNQKIKLSKQVTLAIDFTNKEYYGDKNHPEVIGSKGGKYVRKYLELSCVNPPLCLDVVPVTHFNNEKYDLIDTLINQFYRLYTKTKIQLLLLDREFFTKEVVRFLTERNIPFIMPAKKDRVITKLCEQYKNGLIKQRIKYKFGNQEIFLIFLRVKDEVYVFATNTKRYSPLTIARLYTKRWQIETNFREQNGFTFKSTTTDFDIRYIAFVLGGLLFNIWQLARMLLPYKLESYLFKEGLMDNILLLWQAITKKEVVKKGSYFLLT